MLRPEPSAESEGRARFAFLPSVGARAPRPSPLVGAPHGLAARLGWLFPAALVTASEFADAARLIGAAARAQGLSVPGFRSPPAGGLDRSVRRIEGGVLVSVRLRDRAYADVHADMVAGVLVANGRATDDPLGALIMRAAFPPAEAEEPDGVERAF